jgi:hypothetical protein
MKVIFMSDRRKRLLELCATLRRKINIVESEIDKQDIGSINCIIDSFINACEDCELDYGRDECQYGDEDEDVPCSKEKKEIIYNY